jgi:hypothetical protein
MRVSISFAEGIRQRASWSRSRSAAGLFALLSGLDSARRLFGREQAQGTLFSGRFFAFKNRLAGRVGQADFQASAASAACLVSLWKNEGKNRRPRPVKGGLKGFDTLYDS